MNKSDTIGALAKALAAAQAELKNPEKTKEAKISGQKADFSYMYADFAAALDDIRPVLSKNNLAFTQATRWEPENKIVILETVLIHESGEWIEGTYPVSGITTHREMGSSLSYARRYALLSLIGIQGENDDDGAAEERGKKKRTDKQQGSSSAGLAAAPPNVNDMVSAIGRHDSLPNLNAWARANKSTYDRLRPAEKSRVDNAMEARRVFLAQAPAETLV